MEINKEFSNIVSEILNYQGNDNKMVMLKKYIKLIIVMARKYVRPRSELPDLISEGIRGLLEAIDNFDPSRPAEKDKEKAFKTYAITRIRGRLFEHCIANTRPVHIPTHIAKTLSYIERMIKLLEKDPVLFRENVCPLNVIRDPKHPVEEKLDLRTRRRLSKIKTKIANLAANSMTSYSVIVSRAILGLVSEVRSEDVDLDNNRNSEDINDIFMDAEFLVFMDERQEEMLRLLGERKLFTLKLKMMGYNYKEISEALYKEGFTDHEISRQAVKGSLEAARKKLARGGILCPKS